jgi:hypothetical protein
MTRIGVQTCPHAAMWFPLPLRERVRERGRTIRRLALQKPLFRASPTFSRKGRKTTLSALRI